IDVLGACAALGKEAHRTDLQRLEPACDCIDRFHRYGLQVGAEDGFHRPLPARLHGELLREPWTLAERVRGQPLADFPLGKSKRGLLQRLQGHQFALCGLQLLPAAIDCTDELAIALAELLELLRDLAQVTRALLASFPRRAFLGLEACDLLGRIDGAEIIELGRETLALRSESRQAMFQLLD